MKIKTDDLRMLMDYVEKELAEEVDVTVVAANFAVYFEFTDAEERKCEITIYDAMREMRPDLTKKMQLRTRLKKENQ
ncbi:MAG: hypothetical protein EBR82_70745 [Caulobacteraceae bacterium]|nr:hypothetical protein [Caulobacteraceae bacterium]NDG26422.1 hypothetical protein [Pseudomonadota bacterium]